MGNNDSERELSSSITIDAPARDVWSVITDVRNLAAASPELVTMVPILPGGLREGQNYIGINRRKVVVWPTRSRIRTVSPDRELSWDTVTSGARWVYELEETDGRTELTLRRPVPGALTGISNLFARFLLGGTDGHADELDRGIRQTLDVLKRRIEKN
ncbi:Putative cyclase/dehydrase [Corynebacterium glyciniphilum AJ 3170]|uniref:Putative cyclase/dehydrase n=1 Tax=Corynebacterium glyciniphilum AJ 3170 TaxID=1404245 RepID=X5DK66_9CORY|nr:SRPBCC family protein [Corynebacterium glyciniphilum]AHW63498.1 Putative cyclase/dehydrase [Corynebacterium glyciniphilum AJ 3170]